MKKKPTIPTDPNAAVLYVRVSSEEQVENYSLDTQTKDCTRYCDQKGYKVVRVFREEGESAKDGNRTQFQAMLDWLTAQKVRPGFVVVYDLKRFSRNTKVHFRVKDTMDQMGVQLRCATFAIDDSPEGELNEGIQAVLAQYDNRERQRRVKAGMKEGVTRGRWLWKNVPGYRRNANGDLVLDEREAPLMREAFQRSAGGASAPAVRAFLAKHGIKRTHHSVYELLRNPIYLGRIVSRGMKWEGKGTHPALIDEATFHRARPRRQTDRPRAYVTGSTTDFPLRTVTECESCARGVSGYFAKGKLGKRYPYYRCPACHRNIAARRFEDSFTSLLRRLAVPKGELDLFEAIMREGQDEALESLTKAQEGARQRIAMTQRRLDKLKMIYLDEDMPRSEFLTTKAGLEDQLMADQAILQANPAGRIEPLFELARPILQDPLFVWNNAPIEARPPLIRGLFPSGLRWRQTGEIEPRKSSLLLLPGGADEKSCSLEHQTGPNVEIDLSTLMPWLEQLTAVAGASAVA